MLSIKKILDFVVYSNLFISFAVACFTLQTALFFPKYTGVIEELSILNFITTFLLYNLQRLFYASHENLNEKYNWYLRNRRVLFTGMVLLPMSFSDRLLDFFMQHPDYFFIYFFLAALSLLYFLPPLQLRRYGLFKPFIIAFVFVATSILLPLYRGLNWELFIYAVGQFCFIAALCVLFDVKDLQHDRSLNLKTLPIMLGLKKTKYFCSALIGLYIVTAMLNSQNMTITGYACVSILSFLLIVFLKTERNPYYYFYLVDGLILLQYVILQYLF